MLRCTLTAALALLAAAGPSPAPAQQKYALLIGINEYQHENLPPLTWCEADVTDLAAVLKKGGYQVTLLTGAAADAGRKPTKANIERHLRAVVRQCQKGDTLVLAFSGHGVQFEKEAATDRDDAYFCPLDARPFRDERQTLVSLAMVYREMKKSYEGMRLLFVDACRSDPDSAKGSKGGVTADSLLPPEGVVALFSCRAGERAWEDGKLGHSVFFHHVLEGLRGDVAAPDGEVSLLWLTGHVMKRVPRTVTKLAKGKTQRPELQGIVSLDPVLLVQKATAREQPADVVEIPRTFKNKIGMDLVLIPAGRFRMGSPEGDDETPHPVVITKAFYMGKYPVTVKQFKAFVKDSDYETEAETDGKGGFGYTGEGDPPFDQDPKFSWRNPGFAQGDSHPVVNVTWNDAQKFCEWLSRKEGKVYRLPTEAEWEYACRARTTTRFYCGNADSDLANAANVADRSLKRRFKQLATYDWDDGYAFTAPVDEPSFRGNAFGLHGMHGNVWQWCADWYEEDYYSNSPRQDPPGPRSGKKRVVRGGSWGSNGETCRSAKRDKNPPETRFNDLGFRVGCVVEAGAR